MMYTSTIDDTNMTRIIRFYSVLCIYIYIYFNFINIRSKVALYKYNKIHDMTKLIVLVMI